MSVRQGRGMGMGGIEENLPIIGGGAVGIGATGGLREFVDQRTGPLVGEGGSQIARFTTPSVAYGLGVGGLSGALWMLDVGPEVLQDFYLAHFATAVPAGVVSAALPKGGDGGGNGEASAQTQLTNRSRSGSSGSDFGHSDGQSAETRAAN